MSSGLRRFSRNELTTFLRAVDGSLRESATLVVIGGGAAAIAYNVDIGTQDIDTCNPVLECVQEAAETAREETGLRVPLSFAAVADFPWDYKDRLRRELSELSKLAVFVLEKHDLALSKTVRGQEHDFQQLLELHRKQGLEFDVLVDRYITEMAHEIGEPLRLQLNFLELIEALFGELKRVEAEQSLAAGNRYRRYR